MVKFSSILLLVLAPLFGIGQHYNILPLQLGLRDAVFSPAFYGDSIVVCSNQKDRIRRTVVDNHNTEPVDLYYWDSISHPSAIRFDEHFRTDYHDGPITFNKEGTFCIVSRNQVVNQKNKALQANDNMLGLYQSTRSETGWTELIPLRFNDPSFTCSHPSLDHTGTRLIFTSNMPGGMGGFDLWMSELKNGSWSAPKNLGNAINSADDELFPSQDADQVYFSSTRPGFGELDLYSAQLVGDQSTVKLLDSTFNSAQSDFGLITNDGLASGYFTSNRNGIDKIWKFDFEYPEFNPCDSIVKTISCYTLYEENAHDLGDVGTLLYQWSINGEKHLGIEIDYCFPGPGDYEIMLDVTDTLINKTYYNQAYYLVTIELEKQPYITSPDTVKMGDSIALDAMATHLPDMTIDEYYWDFGDGTRAKGLNVNHTYATTGIYEVQLGVIGNDANGKTSDCVYKVIVCNDGTAPVLSEELPNIIPTQNDDSTLVKENESINAAANDTADVTYGVQVMNPNEELPDNDSILALLEHLRLRIEYLEEEDSTFIYVAGEYERLQDAYPTWRELIALGFDDAIIQSFIKKRQQEIPINQVFEFDALQFDLDKWDIREESIDQLNQLATILSKHPQLQLNISAHTDNTGSETHNQLLSENRANSVRKFLIDANIDPQRIKVKGYGESNPKDTNLTEEGRQKNRRVEFILSDQK